MSLNVDLVNKIHALLPTEFYIINNLVWEIENHELSMEFMKKYVIDNVRDNSCSLALKADIFECIESKHFVFCIYYAAKTQQISDENLSIDDKYNRSKIIDNSIEDDIWNKTIDSYIELIEEEKNDKEFFQLRNNIWKTYQDYLRNPKLITVHNVYDDFVRSVTEKPLDDTGNFMNYYCNLFENSKTFFPLNIFTMIKTLFNVWEKLRVGRLKESYGKQLPFNGD